MNSTRGWSCLLVGFSASFLGLALVLAPTAPNTYIKELPRADKG